MCLERRQLGLSCELLGCILICTNIGAASEERDVSWRRVARTEAFEDERGDDAPACQLRGIHSFNSGECASELMIPATR